MFSSINRILKERNILSHKNEGITVATVSNQQEGIFLAKAILYAIVDTKTVVYLSGGSLQSLYEYLAREEKITPGAVGLVDERFGPKFHEKSNEKMIQDTGLLRYLHMRNIPFYPILIGRHSGKQGTSSSRIVSKKDSGVLAEARPQNDEERKDIAAAYDEKVRQLTATFQKSVGVIGIGPDGHISSIIPNRQDFYNPWFDKERQHLMVSEFDDPNSHYKERVGMTFLALAMVDVLLVPVFGEAKKAMFEKLFSNGSEEEIPARFFKRKEIAPRTIIVTDQQV